MEDVGLLNLHVVLAVDRAGLVGDDGPTHHGVFDVGFLRQIPGMRILAPASFAEQQGMLRWAVKEAEGPVAIRYPRGSEGCYTESAFHGVGENLVCCHRKGGDITIVTYGTLLDNVLQAAGILSRKGIEATVLRLLSLAPLPSEEVVRKMSANSVMIVAEEAARGSGIHEALAWDVRQICPSCRIEGIDLGADYVPHGATGELYKRCGLDGGSIAAFAGEVLGR